MAEISKEHHHHDDDNDNDGNKNNDDKKMKGMKTDIDDNDGNKNNDDKKMKGKKTDDVEDESKSSSKKRKVSDDHHVSSSSSRTLRNEEVSSIGNIMLDMPCDMMSEVCMQLPPSLVMRALFASKLWDQTISDVSFLRKHAVRFHRSHDDGNLNLCFDKEPPGILICPTHTDGKHPVYALLPQDQPQPNGGLKKLLDEFLPTLTTKFPTSIVVDSCNGLILYCESRIADKYVSVDSKPNDINIFICNPVLNQYKPIPTINLVPFFEKPESVLMKGHPHLLFDPSVSLSFKVVVILNESSSEEFQLYLYSSQTEEWKYISKFPRDEKVAAAYWESVMFHGRWYCVRDNDILCLSADDSIFFINLPQIPEKHLREVHYFGDCAGRLQLIQDYAVDRNDDGDHDDGFLFKMSIMEMEVLDQQLPITANWIEKGSFTIDAAAAGYEEGAIKVMHPYKKKDEEAATILLNLNNRRFVSFNLSTQIFGSEITIPYMENDNIEAYPFTPTLFPINVVAKFQ